MIAVPSSQVVFISVVDVGLQDEIAIALGPVGGLVAGDRLHIDVVGEQVVAAMRLVDGALEEELGLEALADQPALHVGESDEHGVDRAAGDIGFELGERVGGHDENSLRLLIVTVAVEWKGPRDHRGPEA